MCDWEERSATTTQIIIYSSSFQSGPNVCRFSFHRLITLLTPPPRVCLSIILSLAYFLSLPTFLHLFLHLYLFHTTHRPVRLRLLLRWKRFSAISPSQWILLMALCSLIAAPLIWFPLRPAGFSNFALDHISDFSTAGFEIRGRAESVQSPFWSGVTWMMTSGSTKQGNV